MITVQELISQLEQYDPSCDVVIQEGYDNTVELNIYTDWPYGEYVGCVSSI
jgi:hypothetical protein